MSDVRGFPGKVGVAIRWAWRGLESLRLCLFRNVKFTSFHFYFSIECTQNLRLLDIVTNIENLTQVSFFSWGQFHQRVYVQLLPKQIPKAQKAA